jgi:DNA-binding CsgD family transcriptional regulator
VILGLVLALASALATNLAFLFKHRGAVLAPPIRVRHPLRSAAGLFRSRWFLVGWIVAIVAWGLHVGALSHAPLSIVQAVLSDGRRLTVCLLSGDPDALLLEEAVAGFRPDALDRLGLTARESEVLRAASVIEGEAELAWELFLSLHAVRERPARLEAKLGVRTAGDAVARALRESL